MINKNNLYIFSVLIFVAFIYFYRLNSIPSGVYVDEATVGYNAYSILQTGRDEYGKFLPVYFRLMGSYTPSLFIYIAAIFIKIFGLGITTLRSISAISMLISIYFLYLLLKELDLFKNKINYLAVTFFFAISPWMVFNARIGYETTLGFLIFNIGIYYLFKSLKNSKYLNLSIIFLALSTYVSHNQRFLAPLFLIVFLFVFHKNYLNKKSVKYIKQSILIGSIISIPNLFLIASPAFWIKNGQFNLGYFSNYFMYLSPKVLFWENPDIDLQHTIPKASVMFDWMVVPYLVGFYLLLKNIKETKYKFILMYVLISLFPAVFSGYFHSSQRSLPFAVPLILIIGIGLDYITNFIGKRTYYLGIFLFGLYSLVILYSSYFVLFPVERAHAWNYGYDQVAEYISDNPNENFLLDHDRNPRAYSLLLYHMKVDPTVYQDSLGDDYKENYYIADDPAASYKILNTTVKSLNWETDLHKGLIIIGDSLSISQTQAIEHNLSKIHEIKDSQNNIIFEFYKVN